MALGHSSNTTLDTIFDFSPYFVVFRNSIFLAPGALLSLLSSRVMEVPRFS